MILIIKKKANQSRRVFLSLRINVHGRVCSEHKVKAVYFSLSFDATIYRWLELVKLIFHKLKASWFKCLCFSLNYLNYWNKCTIKHFPNFKHTERLVFFIKTSINRTFLYLLLGEEWDLEFVAEGSYHIDDLIFVSYHPHPIIREFHVKTASPV